MAKQCLQCLYLVVFIVVLAACVVTPGQPTPRNHVPGEATKVLCSWSGTAYAWIDGNANGIWDEGEAPLPGVRFSLTRGWWLLPDEDPVSDKEGRVTMTAIFGTVPSCYDVEKEAEVYVEVPPGYRLTTEPKRKASSGKSLEFGFALIVPAVTSMPESTATP